MRVKAAEVKAENKKIREAGKLAAAQERVEKLRQAEGAQKGRASPKLEGRVLPPQGGAPDCRA
jgi:hypothetical protein